MREAGAGRKTFHAAIAGIMLAGSLLLGGRLAAQAQDDAAPSAQEREIAEILYRHDTVTDEARALGGAAYRRACAGCHDGGVDRAPPVTLLGTLSPDAIHRTLTSGRMQVQAMALSPQERVAVAEYLTGRRTGGESAAAEPPACAAGTGWFDRSQPPAFAGWGLDSANSHKIPGELAGLGRGNVGRLTLKWALAFPSVLYARSQPALAGGAMFVGGDDGKVYALDPETGCAHWTFAAAGPVRMGIVAGAWRADAPGEAPLIYFGDLLGNAYALDAASGKVAWKRAMDSHVSATLTGSPALHEGVLYVPVSSLEEPAAAVPGYECCTFRGALAALDSRTGEEIWRAYMVDEPVPQGENAKGVRQWGPSGAAIWSTPLVDAARGQVYVTTGDNYSSPSTAMSDAIVAVDMKTGRIAWAYQATAGDSWNVSCDWADVGNCPEEAGPDHDFGAAPVLARDGTGREYLLAGQKSGAVYAVDPATGDLLWTRRLGRGGALGGVHFGIAAAGDKVFVPISDFPDGAVHELEARPGIYALDLATGDYAWRAPAENACGGKRFCQPGYGDAISVTDELVLAGSTDGHVRILDAGTGKVLWDFDTDRAFATVSGTAARGGSISGGSAPIAWRGKLIVNSGYGGLGKMPGNVLLVFDVN